MITQRTTRFILSGIGTLDIPISRPEIVIDQHDRVYVIYRGDLCGGRLVCQRLLPPDYAPDPIDFRTLWDGDLERMEPVLDRCLWRDRKVLSMLVQRNLQPSGDVTTAPIFEPIRLCEWDLLRDW